MAERPALDLLVQLGALIANKMALLEEKLDKDRLAYRDLAVEDIQQHLKALGYDETVEMLQWESSKPINSLSQSCDRQGTMCSTMFDSLLQCVKDLQIESNAILVNAFPLLNSTRLTASVQEVSGPAEDSFGLVEAEVAIATDTVIENSSTPLEGTSSQTEFGDIAHLAAAAVEISSTPNAEDSQPSQTSERSFVIHDVAEKVNEGDVTAVLTQYPGLQSVQVFEDGSQGDNKYALCEFDTAENAAVAVVGDYSSLLDEKFASGSQSQSSLSEEASEAAGSISSYIGLEASTQCTESPPLPSEPITSPPAPCTLYIAKVPRHVEENDLRQVFSKFGAIHSVSRPHSGVSEHRRDYAFVEFTRAVDAQQAINVAKSRVGITIGPHNDRLYVQYSTGGRRSRV